MKRHDGTTTHIDAKLAFAADVDTTRHGTVLFVTADSLPYEGRLGVVVPNDPEESSGVDVDVVRLARAHQANTILSLSMRDEVDDHGSTVALLAAATEEVGLAFENYPLDPDEAPTEDELYLGFVTHVVEQLKSGEHVVLHSGVDSTRCGMVIGSVLVASGLDAATAIGVVDEMDATLLGHEPQRTFITDFARAFGLVGDALTPIVEGCLEARGWTFDRSRKDDVALFDLSVGTAAATYRLRFVVRERQRAVTCMFRLPVKAPADRRWAVAALVCQINYRRWLGAFELDLRDGELVFRTDLMVANGTLGTKAVQKSITASFAACDEALPQVCRVAFSGETPEHVLGLEDE